MNKPDNIHWLSEEEYSKAKTQLGMQVAGVFDFMKVDNTIPIKYVYGMGDFVPGAIDEIIRLAEDFGLRVRGVDKPISIERIRTNRL
jgi:hypothetical protein